jgi:hypothetical protein
VIAGEVDGVKGAVTEIFAEPEYLDVFMPPGVVFEQPVPRGHTALAYVFEGEAALGASEAADGTRVAATRLVLFSDGEIIGARTEGTPMRFLLLSGRPLNEPIARYGPFVMNTRDEIQQALRELAEGTFVRS